VYCGSLAERMATNAPQTSASAAQQPVEETVSVEAIDAPIPQ